MTRHLIQTLGLLTTFYCFSGIAKNNYLEVEWSVHPVKPEFLQNEPIVLAYEFVNHSKSEIWVPKSINPFASIVLRLYDPDGRVMPWTGAQFTFKYNKSDLQVLPPGRKSIGTFIVPRAYPGDKDMEKGGFCFQKPGAYKGNAKFKLGLNAIYHRDELPGQVAAGPYLSEGLTFNVR